MTVLLVGDRNNVDFAAPVRMTADQQTAFLATLRRIVKVVEVEEALEARDERLGDKNFGRAWTPKEYAILLRAKNEGQVARDLGRSWMSVVMMRGEWTPRFQQWADRNHQDIMKAAKSGELEELIAAFLADQKLAAAERRRERRLASPNGLATAVRALETEVGVLRLRQNIGRGTLAERTLLASKEAELARLRKKQKATGKR